MKKNKTSEQEWYEFLSTPIDISKINNGAWTPNTIELLEKNRKKLKSKKRITKK